MNAQQLESILRLDQNVSKKFAGVFAADTLPSNLSNLPKFLIVNSDVHSGPGQHWLALYIPEKGPSEFFDSLGLSPKHYLKSFEQFLINYGPKYIYSNKRLQNYDSNTCGLFVLYYVILRCKGYNMQDIVNHFSSNLAQNDILALNSVHTFMRNVYWNGTNEMKEM